jgi:signal transduction histidine kinase
MADAALAKVPEAIKPAISDYTSALCHYVAEPDDNDRDRAHHLGRTLLMAGCGPEVLLEVHAEAMRRCAKLPEREAIARANQILAAASAEFIAEYGRKADEQRREAACYRSYALMLERLNKDIMHLNEDLHRQHEDLQKAHAEQVRLNQQKGDLLNLVSHEIRTPLTALLGYGEFLEEGTYGPLTPEQEDVLHKMIQSGRDLLLLINNLLDLSKLEAGRLRLDRQPTAVTELVMHAQDQIEPLARRKGLTVQVEPLPPDLPPVWVDPMRILQVLVNLLGNAIKFTDPTGSITLGARRLDHEVEIWVRDTGIGISAEAQARLFQRFTQFENVRRYGGTGLGLSISRDLLALHGGQISVESEPGKGATFRITLPLWVEANHPTL